MNQEEDRIDALLRRSFDGPVADDGFADTVMLAVPVRRRRLAWPAYAGMAAGAAVSWVSLAQAPWPDMPLQAWLAGGFHPATIACAAGAAMLSVLACWWGLSEGSRR